MSASILRMNQRECMRSKFTIKNILLIVLLIAATLSADEHDEEMAVLRSQIDSYTAKLKDVRAKIEHETAKAAVDSISYAAFLEDVSARTARIREERDSLLVMAEKLRHNRDSLSGMEDLLNRKEQSVALKQTAFLKDLRKHCRQLIDSLRPFEPFNLTKQIGALRFLEGEIAAATVGAAEGLERYWQIVAQIEQASHRIETWNGASPIPAHKADVAFLRMGFVWLACVGGDTSPAFVYSARKQSWEELKDSEKTAAVRKAVRVASGMASPQLTPLPVKLDLQPVAVEGRP